MNDNTFQSLRDLYNESEVSKAFFGVLARRKNDANVTKVDRMLGLLLNDGIHVVRVDVVRVMQRLEELKVGRFIVGRHSNPSRFEWETSALRTAKVASGESDEIDLGEPPVTSSVDQDDLGEEDVLEHRFHLRPDFSVTMELPVDFTSAEAERLAAFIRTLPIGPINQS